MKKSLALVLMMCGLVACSQQGQKAKPAPAKYSPKDVVANEFNFAGNKERVSEILNEMGVNAQFILIEEDAYQVRYSGATFQEIEERIRPEVRLVEPNFKVELQYSMNKTEWPSDQYFFKQWAMNNIGQSAPFGLPGKRGADMGLMEAWKKTTGSRDIKVAVIDTGVDYTHPDLKANMWVNEKEAPANGGVPGEDDDGNGYVDDVHGFDFVSEGRSSLWYGIPGDPDPQDDSSGHGTHCAGSIGAVSGNDIGIVGVNWEVQIVAVRALGEFGGSTADLARAIHYARKVKVDIMSNSWGGGGKSELILEAIKRSQDSGILFVAAAGNDTNNNDVKPVYPASYEVDNNLGDLKNVLAVGASDNMDNPAEFSNYGHKGVHVFAPGVNIISTYPVHKTAEGRPPYAIMSGTSMATPYVSGVAALMMAYNNAYRGNPELVKQVLINSSDQAYGLVGRSTSNGRVNALRALEADATLSDAPVWQSQSYNVNQRGFTQELVDIRHKIQIEGAEKMRVHFNFVQIAEPYDSLYVYDKNYRLITQVESTDTVDYWSPVVPGDTVYVRFANSILKRITMMPQIMENESACTTQGGVDIVEVNDGKYTCMVDNPLAGGSGGDSEFNSYNSEGFSIDQVEYVMSEQTPEEGLQ